MELSTRETRFWLIALIFFCVLRFFSLSTAVFILDEPLLQLHLSTLFADHQFPTAGLLGTQGFHYGPAPSWIYSLTRIVSGHPYALIATQGLCFLFAFYLLHRSIRASLGPHAALIATTFAASSPFLFFYSRQAWDNPFLVLFSALALFAFSHRKLKLMGLSFGLMAATHLMAGPLILVLGGITLVEAWEHKKKPLDVVVPIGFFMLLPLIPYLPSLVNDFHSVVRQSSGPAVEFRRIQQLLLNWTQGFSYLSFWQFSYFLDQRIMNLREVWPAALVFLVQLDLPNWGLKASSTWTILQNPREYRLGFTAFLSLVAMLMLFQIKQLSTFPHYFMAVWWVPFVLLAVTLRSHPHRLQPLLRWGLRLGIAHNLVFLILVQGFVGHFSGTRGVHYSTTVGELIRVTRELCNKTQALGPIPFSPGETKIFSPSLQYIATQLHECRGKTIDPSTQPRFVLSYPSDSTLDARLILRER